MKKRILCFGDSNTWGAVPAEGTRHPDDVRWTGILAAELGNEYQVIEEPLSTTIQSKTDFPASLILRPAWIHSPRLT